MLFNSYEFIFAFLPSTLVCFFLLGRLSRGLAFSWLIVASVVFYAWWRPINVLIILPSIAVNYGLARLLERLRAGGRTERRATSVLGLGVVFNVAFLGYFKYTNFLVDAANDLVGTQFVLTQIVLPLGISFITFQKIAFLVDVHAGRVKEFSLRDFGLFVLFFPQLIAGPIVHFREVMPQFQRLSCRYDGSDVAVGMTLFVVGLFKKVILADGIAEHIGPLYEGAGTGRASFFPAWFAAIGFTFQMYFDFSGYTDMAIGIARCFGVRLPPNFDSPLKARSIIDFWLRWHMTLTRFLSAYLYNPVVMALTRRRMQRHRSVLSGRKFEPSAFMVLLALPTLFTMFVSGLWHGAGYLFIAWGLLHGVYLVINHAWREARRTGAIRSARVIRTVNALSLPITLFAVCAAMVLFRSSDWTTASALLRGMAGLDGIALPPSMLERLAPLLGVVPLVPSAELSGTQFGLVSSWVALLGFIALCMPNSLELTRRFEPALGYKPRPEAARGLARRVTWVPTGAWAALVAGLSFATVLRLGGKSEFLYWQF